MPEDVRRLVGANVRRLRIAAGLSQAALSERMGVDRGLRERPGKGREKPDDHHALAHRKSAGREDQSAVR
jgi:transcriptional regulator with XRE-family HTH domain